MSFAANDPSVATVMGKPKKWVQLNSFSRRQQKLGKQKLSVKISG